MKKDQSMKAKLSRLYDHDDKKNEIIIWLVEIRIFMKSKLYKKNKNDDCKIIDQFVNLYIYICIHIVTILRILTLWSII